MRLQYLGLAQLKSEGAIAFVDYPTADNLRVAIRKEARRLARYAKTPLTDSQMQQRVDIIKQLMDKLRELNPALS